MDEELEGCEGLRHIYGMQSHLCHVDPIGLDLLMDYATRPKEEASLKNISHVARIYSDIAWMSFLTTDLISKLTERPTIEPETVEKLRKISTLTELHRKRFARSQDAFYTKMKK